MSIFRGIIKNRLLYTPQKKSPSSPISNSDRLILIHLFSVRAFLCVPFGLIFAFFFIHWDPLSTKMLIYVFSRRLFCLGYRCKGALLINLQYKLLISICVSIICGLVLILQLNSRHEFALLS